MSLRVAHVIGGLGVGGAETALLNLVRYLKASEAQCTVYSLGTEGGMRTRFEEAGIDLRCLDMRGQPLRSLWRLYRAFQAEPPDVVQTWMYHADFIGGVVARLAGCRTVIWGIHSIGLAREAKGSTRVVQWLCARLSWWVPSLILCVATASKEAHARAGYEAARMEVLPNGYDFEAMAPSAGARERLRAAWGLGSEHRVVGTVGRDCEEKDYPNFIRAAVKVAAADPQARFLMVGRNLDRQNASLAEALGGSGIRDRFILTGERRDVPDCLAAMDLFCLPSRMEAFPNVLVEAMASGLPCVSTDAGDAALILSEGGLVVPRGQDGALAQALLDLLGRPKADLERLGALGRARVRAAFSIQGQAVALRSIYARLQGKGC